MHGGEPDTRILTLAQCHAASGVAIVIDVLRAFTTAAFAFAGGAESITLVADVDEAFRLREQDPDLLLMGEVDGLPIDGFDLPNSPATIEPLDLDGRKLAMRTTAGTRGAVRLPAGLPAFVAAMTNAAATASAVAALSPRQVDFIATGVRAAGGGEEDIACAEHIAARITGGTTDETLIRRRILASRAAAKFRQDPASDFPAADLEAALEFDRFDFAMRIERHGARPVLCRTPPRCPTTPRV